MIDVQVALGIFSGGLVGFTLGLVGGGGSILAVPLMVYLVRVPDAHVAIGTSALCVAANALASLGNHARAHNVKWRCGAIYAGAGVLGALAGANLGKLIDGDRLLLLFGLLMLGVAAVMFRRRAAAGDPAAQCNRQKAPKVVLFGAGTGLLSGFFGIGGGFLIVPGLIASTGMPLVKAVGTSLVAVSAFGITTAVVYALSGFVDWPLAALFIGGGWIGGLLGTRAALRLGARDGALGTVFAGLVVAVALYVIWRSAAAILP